VFDFAAVERGQIGLNEIIVLAGSRTTQPMTIGDLGPEAM
jgi:hypothetical protein